MNRPALLFALGLLLSSPAFAQVSGTLSMPPVGTKTNDNASAGFFGEIIEANCAVATSGASVAFTNATPTVGTWSGSPWSGTGTFTCPMNITANAPTGLSTGTNFWVVPINATTFHVATSAANAIAGTFAATTGASSTANLTTTALITTTNTFNLGAVALTAGDWDCSASIIYNPAAATSVTNLEQGISQTSATQGAFGTFTDFETAANVMTATSSPVFATPTVRESLSATTNVFSVTTTIFTVSTNAASSDLRCRRAR